MLSLFLHIALLIVVWYIHSYPRSRNKTSNSFYLKVICSARVFSSLRIERWSSSQTWYLITPVILHFVCLLYWTQPVFAARNHHIYNISALGFSTSSQTHICLSNLSTRILFIYTHLWSTPSLLFYPIRAQPYHPKHQICLFIAFHRYPTIQIYISISRWNWWNW